MALSTGSALLDWLDGWGPELRSRVQMAQQKAWAEVAPNMTGESTKPGGLRVGTDCSGIEAPIHALIARGMPHRHSWSSEVAAAPRKVLLENTPPADHMYQDVLQSSKVNAPYVHLYVSGFNDVWTFLRSVRCLTQKHSLGNDRFALRSLGRASCHR